jgi:hypothetical protein
MLLPWYQPYTCISANRYGAAQYARSLGERMKLIFYSQTLLIMLQLQHVFPQPTFRTRPPQLNHLPRPPILPRFCRPLIRHLPYIARPTITDITLLRITPAPPLCRPDYAHAPRKTRKKVHKCKHCGSIHTLRCRPDQGGDMCKVWFRLVLKCGFV